MSRVGPGIGLTSLLALLCGQLALGAEEAGRA